MVIKFTTWFSLFVPSFGPTLNSKRKKEKEKEKKKLDQ